MASEALTLREHLDELRRRLLYSAIAVVLAAVAAFVFRSYILDFLLQPGFGDEETGLIATEVLETVSVIFKVVFLAAIAVALPIVLFQVIMFVSPGLTTKEKAYVYLFLPGVLGAFIAGSAFAYYVMFPPAYEFLTDFGSEFADPEIRISSYMNTITTMMFWMGVVFQLPIVLFAMSRFGLVTPRMLGRFRRFAIVFAFIAAAIITPTFDPINQTLVAVPIIVLYEIGIVLSMLGQRLRHGPTPRTGPSRLARLRSRLRPRLPQRVKFWRWRWRFWRRG